MGRPPARMTTAKAQVVHEDPVAAERALRIRRARAPSRLTTRQRSRHAQPRPPAVSAEDTPQVVRHPCRFTGTDDTTTAAAITRLMRIPYRRGEGCVCPRLHRAACSSLAPHPQLAPGPGWRSLRLVRVVLASILGEASQRTVCSMEQTSAWPAGRLSLSSCSHVVDGDRPDGRWIGHSGVRFPRPARDASPRPRVDEPAVARPIQGRQPRAVVVVRRPTSGV
jgi:hypothetical protein